MNNTGNEKNQVTESAAESSKSNSKSQDFKFFKNCSASLKRFSVIIFVINLFFAISLSIVAIVVCLIYMEAQMLSLLALPIATVFVILVVLARFISALIYGFAEIVEKNEKTDN